MQLVHNKSRKIQLAFSLIVSLLIAGCARPTNASVEYSGEKILAYVEDAKKLALEWDSGAGLIEVKQYFDETTQQSSSLVFTFESLNLNYQVLYVTCVRGSCRSSVFAVPFSFIEYGWEPIDIPEGIIDGVEAINIGINAGGDQIIQSINTIVWARLGRDTPRNDGPIVWVAYFSNLKDQSRLMVIIDPISGSVLRTE